MGPGRRDRHRARSAHLDQPSGALLGAGAAAADRCRACDRAPTSRARRWGQRSVAQSLATWGAPLPEGLRWDLYLGPVAEDIPYHPIYHPFNWRGWTDFGVGALGDMGAHLIDQAYWSLGLTQPTSDRGDVQPCGARSVPLPPARRSSGRGGTRPAAAASRCPFRWRPRCTISSRPSASAGRSS